MGTVENCVNEGNVVSTAGYAGGIASEITTSATITNCINTANIESKTGFNDWWNCWLCKWFCRFISK